MHQPLRPPSFTVPSLIKRNTALVALSQSFVGAGMQFAYGLGPLMVMALTHSAGLAGLSVALIGLSRFLVSFPVGKITDAYGRKPGIQLGLALAVVGTIVLGYSVILHSPLMLVVGMLAFGMGMNASQQMRVAATDMFPPQLRAQALGYVALGALGGLAVSPALVAGAEALAHRVGHEPLALPWLLLPVMIIGGMLIVTRVKPDPKEIGMRLEHYYPGYAPPKASGAGGAFSVREMLRDVHIQIAIVCNCAAQGNMSIVMVLTSLVLHDHGHSLTAIAFSHMFHSAGMFGFTVPIGKLADRLGRNVVMLPGVATTLIGAGLVTFTHAFWSVTLGTFLVGIGWAAANVSATALIADHAPTRHRGRAIGFNDSCAGATSVLTAIITGPVIEWYGLPAAGACAVVVAAVPLVMWPVVRKRAAGA